MRLVNVARILVGVWVILSCGVFVLMLNGFKPYQALILLLWVAAPLPLAYWIGSRLAATPRAWGAIVVGLALAFAFGAWRYWDAFLGPSSRTESNRSPWPPLPVRHPGYRVVGGDAAQSI